MAKLSSRKRAQKSAAYQRSKRTVRLDDKTLVATVRKRKGSEDLRGRAAWFQNSAAPRK